MDTRDIAKYANKWTKSVPVAVSYVTVNGMKMCQVVATKHLIKGQVVAAYPVVIALDDHIGDATYAISIHKKNHRQFNDISGIPSKKAFRHYEKKEGNAIPPIGLYLNEPFDDQMPNCKMIFPTFKAVDPKRLVGKYAEAFIRTTKRVAPGEALTWCYGCDYARDYPTKCTHQC